MPSLALTNAIESLYKLFVKVGKPRTIDGCPCCIERGEIATLLAKQLRELTPDDLASYASSAFLTVGDAADYLYFLPRILEITATEPSWWPSPEVTGRAIRSAKPEAWTPEQRKALDGFLIAIIDEVIRVGDFHRIDDWVCAIGRMGFDVQPYLAIIARSPEAVLVFFETNAESLPRNELSNAFWELPSPAHDAVVDWFYSPGIAKIPFDAYGCTMTRLESTPRSK